MPAAQRVKFRNQRGPLLLRHPAVQDEWRRHPRCQGEMDGVEMLCALGQHQYLAALLEGTRDFCGYGFSPGKVTDQMSENVLDAGSGRQLDARLPRSRQHRQIVWCTGRLGGRVPDRPTLHEDDRLSERPKVGQNTRIDSAVADMPTFEHWTADVIAVRQAHPARLARRAWAMLSADSAKTNSDDWI